MVQHVDSRLGCDGSADWPSLYGELKRLAGSYLRRERREHTLQPTALVHEAFVRLSASPAAANRNRVTFLAAAANVMRRVLVDHARARRCRKRGGSEAARLDLDTSVLPTPADRLDILELEESLVRLAELEPRLARIVELRYFAGLNEAESASVLNVSLRTAQLDWRAARAWLKRELSD